MDSHNLEPQELNDRMRLYSHKLSQQWGTLQEDTPSVANGNCIYIYMYIFGLKFGAGPISHLFISFIHSGLLKDIPSGEAERLLSAAPITDADLHLVKSSSS